MNLTNFTIRRERQSDWRAAEEVTRTAFWNVYRPGCSEHYILHRFRGLPGFVAELSFVIELEGKIIGHIMYSKGEISLDGGGSLPVMAFGPVSVLPEYQRHGFGSLLISHTMDRAREMGCGAIVITGNPAFYHRFGFVDGPSLGIYYEGIPRSEATPFFMVKTLKEGYLDGITGSYSDPPGYWTDDAEVDAFDRDFPPLEKKKLPGQLKSD